MKRLKGLFIIFTILLTLFFIACSAKESNSSNDALAESDGGGNNVVVETSRKIWYSVDIVFESTDINEVSNKLRDKAAEYNGYVEKSNLSINEESEKSSGYVVYKIPTESLNSFLDFVDGEGGVKSKNIQATDITSKYNEVEARLEILESSKAAYLNLLEKATSTYEIIEINTRIEEIETEIKRLQKEKGSYDNLLEYSTVTIRFNGEEDEKYLSGYGEYFVGFFKVLFKIIVYMLPFAMVAGAILGVVIITSKLSKKVKNKNEK